ncbi:MAG TPA: hypothetical protein VKM72_32520 [Thermoanaerobaculia bacterium]|nr:hypothetical protein [Thermoanaerobaculia bacterium]
MLLHLGQDQALVELGELVLVGVLVDGLLVDEGLQELVFAALQLDNLALGGGSLGRDVLSPGLPGIEDDPPEEGQELRARPELLQEGEELGFELVPGHVRPAAVGLGRAVVVGVAPAVAALRPGAGERLVAVAAGEEASQRKVRIVALLRHDQAIGTQEALALPEGLGID